MTARDWRWRRRIRSAPRALAVYRVVVAVVGLAIVALGLVLVPFPGPGWAIVFLGVFVWATEFTWARRLYERGTGLLRQWTTWVQRQPWWVRSLLGLSTAAFVALVVLCTVWASGVPGWLPDLVAEPLRSHLPDGPWQSR